MKIHGVAEESYEENVTGKHITILRNLYSSPSSMITMQKSLS